MHQEAIAESRQDEEIQEGVIQKHEARNTKLTEDLIKLGNENKELKNEAKIYKVILEAKVTENVKLEETNAFYQSRLFPTLTSAPAATHRQDSVSMMGGGGGSRPFSCTLYWVTRYLMFSATRALTLLCVIWTEAHTSRQVKMTVWPYFHGFAMVLNNWFGSSVANLTHGH